MPKSTFFNLTLEKRDKIIQCAKAEFAKYGFYNSSINRIIKEADISRGSFYQYFENKEDIYAYLLNSFTEIIIEKIKSEVGGKRHDVFQLQLFVFDCITKEAKENKDRDFIICAISNMDIKLANNLMMQTSFNKEDLSLICMDNIKISKPEEFMTLFNIMIISLTNELVAYFNNMKGLEGCRQSLITTANLIKYGCCN